MTNTDNKNKKDKSEFENFWEFLRYLLTDKRGILTLLISIGSLMSVFFFVFYLAKPQKIEITSNGGSISFEGGTEKGAILSLSPTGGKNSPWVKTGIEVKKGDKVKITASGRVNTSLKRLIYSAQNDELNDFLWSGPEGQEEEPKSQPKGRKQYRIKPELGFGALLAAIRDDQGQIDIIPICNEHVFMSKSDGDLLLTVNDVWLSEDRKEVYLPNFKENEGYYLEKAKEISSLSSEDFNTLSDKIKFQKSKEAYEKRSKKWDEIQKNGNWKVWYDDNVGAFSVVITINSKQTDSSQSSCPVRTSHFNQKTHQSLSQNGRLKHFGIVIGEKSQSSVHSPPKVGGRV